MRSIFLSISMLTASLAFAQDLCANRNITAEMERAQSLYTAKKWTQSVQSFDQVCPCVAPDQVIRCKLWAIRALSQDSATLTAASLRLDTLIIQSEPEQIGFGEMLLTSSGVLLRQQRPMDAWKAWRQAKQVSLQGQEDVLKALCDEIRSQIKDTVLTGDCNRVPPLSKTLSKAVQPVTASSLSSSTIAPFSSIKTVSSSSTTHSDPGTWVLQFGAFGSKDNAELLLQNLRKRKIPSRLVTKNASDRVLWLVQTEPFPTKEAAMDYGQSTLSPLQLDFQALPAQ